MGFFLGSREFWKIINFRTKFLYHLILDKINAFGKEEGLINKIKRKIRSKRKKSFY